MNKHRILLVDDDPYVLKTIGSALESEGYQVATADNGGAACEMISQFSYDLVLTDLVMGDIDGISVLRKAKQVNPATMAIILTGYGDLESAVEALRCDADDYLQKPCHPDEICFKIAAILEKQELRKRIKIYEDILPICCVCKNIRDDYGKDHGTGEWISIERYLLEKANVSASSTYCPGCRQRLLDEINNI